MDVHKESIEVTLAEQGGEVRRLGQIGGERVFVYEAGPCGFWIYRELAALGERSMVVSPALALGTEAARACAADYLRGIC
jgi:transposase